jgi:hypothetical protein
MTKGIENKPLPERYEHLFSVISGARFLKLQGIGKDVPFFICWYKAEEAVEMKRILHLLINRLEKQRIRILEINLYDLSIELLRDRGVWEQIIASEDSFSKEQLLELLQGVLDTETHLVPAIEAKMASSDFDAMFMTGIGEVFPYIRSHNVLHNLQKIAEEKPTVIFYPGVFKHSIESGDSLNLFSILFEDKYYRAFDIYHCEP